MIFLSDFDPISSTWTYILATDVGRKAIIIDPVIERSEHYLAMLKKLNLKLSYAFDTHTHADHISARAKLRALTNCVTVMGAHQRKPDVGIQLQEGDILSCDGLNLKTLFTPGHTDDSYSFLIGDRLFTGDTLLIGGTGRTDFQNGDPVAAFHSLHEKILKLPDTILIYPAHDYNQNQVSTIGYEKKYNPRLQVKTPEAYAALMNNLNLPYPKKMDVAFPANLNLSISIEDYVTEKELIDPDTFLQQQQKGKLIAVDLREPFEQERDGYLPNTLSIPFHTLEQALAGKSHFKKLLEENKNNLSQFVLFCAYGERSALAIKLLRAANYNGMRHLVGGINALK